MANESYLTANNFITDMTEKEFYEFLENFRTAEIPCKDQIHFFYDFKHTPLPDGGGEVDIVLDDFYGKFEKTDWLAIFISKVISEKDRTWLHFDGEDSDCEWGYVIAKNHVLPMEFHVATARGIPIDIFCRQYKQVELELSHITYPDYLFMDGLLEIADPRQIKAILMPDFIRQILATAQLVRQYEGLGIQYIDIPDQACRWDVIKLYNGESLKSENKCRVFKDSFMFLACVKYNGKDEFLRTHTINLDTIKQ